MIIWFAGGGTWWHIFPIASLIDFIKTDPKCNPKTDKIYRFGEKDGLEEKVSDDLIKKYDNIKFVSIISGKIRRKPDLKEFIKNTVDVFKFIWGVVQSIYYIKKYHIDVLFSKWGYISLPVSFACKLTHTRLIVHESDTNAGISTKLASKFAEKIYLGFEGAIKWWEFVGQILSDDLIKDINEKYTNKENIKDNKTTVLINCGSLGSKTIHQTILDILWTHLATNFDRKVIVGLINKNFEEKYMWFENVEVIWFADQKKMWNLYQLSDISICRAGSTTLVEQKLFGIKQIILPIPRTHDQFKNADYFKLKYNDVVIDQNNKNYKEKIIDTLSKNIWFKKWNIDIEEIKEKISIPKQKITYQMLHI